MEGWSHDAGTGRPMHSDHGVDLPWQRSSPWEVPQVFPGASLAGLKMFPNTKLSNLFPPTSPYDHNQVLGQTQNFGQQSQKRAQGPGILQLLDTHINLPCDLGRITQPP